MSRSGFTIIEAIVVIVILATVALLSVPLLAGDLSKRDAKAAAADGVDAMREAQSGVMTGKNGARFGVHFESGKFTLFQGSAYSAADANNVVHAFTTRVRISAVSLAPGGACTVVGGTGNCDVHFADRRGIPTETGTITFSDDAGSLTAVTVGAAGAIELP